MPGVLEAENFDRGGQNAGYLEVFGETESSVYRNQPIENVDLQVRSAASGGVTIMEASAGEWLKYTINVPTTGRYNVGVRYASEFRDGTFHFEVDGVDVTGPIQVDSTGNWGVFQTINRRVNLNAGTRVIKIVVDSNSYHPITSTITPVICNFDALIFSAVPYDAENDGRANLTVFRPGNGVWYVSDPAVTGLYDSVHFGLSGDLPVAADYDGDGRPEKAVFRPSGGVWYFLSSANGSFSSVRFGLTGDVPLPADFDGDGRADINLFRPSDGVWHRLSSRTGQYSSFKFGASGDLPALADFDADGRADVAVFRPSTGEWHLLNARNAEYRIVRFGVIGDVPVPADFDGDGRADIAVWRPSDGSWHILSSRNGSYWSVRFGATGDKPMAADFDGDGRDDIAIFRPSNGVWYLMCTTDGLRIYQFGITGDLPTMNRGQ